MNDLHELSHRLAERVGELAEHLIGAGPTQRGRMEWRFRSRGSLAVEVAGERRGLFHDHEAGRGGDALALVAHLRGVPIAEAIRWARAWLGEAGHDDAYQCSERSQRQPVAQREASQPATLELARAIWREAVAADAPGSLVPIYLATRGLALEAGALLRFHPACPRGSDRLPAMLALMTDATTGEPCGVHRTFLLPDGSAKATGPLPARMMAGAAGLVRLVPDAEVTMGLGLAEGIETGLSVMQGYGWRPVWSATSAGMIRAFPVLPGIEHLTVFADADGAGMVAAETCAARWAEAGHAAEIITAPAGQDFNDTLRSRSA